MTGHFDGWSMLDGLARYPGARFTLLLALIGMALRPRLFAVIGAVIVAFLLLLV